METEFPLPTNLWVGLATADPGETGSQANEISGNGYARVQTDNADWNTATDADPSVVSNAVLIEFPTATGDWESGSLITHAFIASASSGGTIYMSADVTTPKIVESGDTAQFLAETIVIRLD